MFRNTFICAGAWALTCSSALAAPLVATVPVSSMASQAIPAPCDSGSATATDLHSCNEYITQGYQAGSNKIPGIAQQVRAQVQKNVDCIYLSGIDPDPTQPGAGCVGPKFAACSLIPNAFTNSLVEDAVDHNQKSCGQFQRIVPIPNAHSRKVDLYYQLDSPYGDYERTHMNGGYVLALSEATDRILTHLANTRSLTLAQTGNVPSACSQFAASVQGMSQQAQQALSAIQAELASQGVSNQTAQATAGLTHGLATQQNLGDILNCYRDFNSPQAAGPAPDLGSLRQSAQQLCGMRAALESTYTQLVTCEIFWEAQSKFLQLLGAAQQKALLQDMTQKAKVACLKECGDQKASASALGCLNTAAKEQSACLAAAGSSTGSAAQVCNASFNQAVTACLGSSNSQAQSCGNTCYQNFAKDYLQNFFKTNFPPTSFLERAHFGPGSRGKLTEGRFA